MNQRHRLRYRHRQPLPPTFSSLCLLSALAVFSALAPTDAAPWPGDGCACGAQPLHPLLFLSPCAPPSFPLCHFEPTVAELVVIALRWLHFRSLSSLLRLGYVSDAFAARIPTFLRAKNVARFDLEETMTEGSDVAADYSSDGSEDRCEAVIGLVFICAITACAAL